MAATVQLALPDQPELWARLAQLEQVLSDPLAPLELRVQRAQRAPPERGAQQEPPVRLDQQERVLSVRRDRPARRAQLGLLAPLALWGVRASQPCP